MSPSAIVNVLPTVTPFPKLSTLRASVLHGPKDLRLETRSVAAPARGELQVGIKTTGLCGSDVSYYNHFRNGDLQAVAPLSLGHESSGVVIGIGKGVTGFQLGDRVALEVGVPCDGCRVCQQGRYNLCSKMRFRSSAKSVPHFQGTLQDKINHPAKWCHKIPAHVSLDAAALLEPLSVAIHAVRRASIEQGHTVFVFGAGTVGLLVAAVAKLSGATRVLISDIDSGRVKYATDNGFATQGFVVAKPSAGGHITDNLESAKKISLTMMEELDPDQEDSDGEGADVTFDCTGKEISMQAGFFATRPGGRMVMVGMGTPIQTLQMSTVHLREVDIIGIFRYANTYPTGIQILSSSVLPSLDRMVTHRFSGLGEARNAFELAGRTKDDDGNLVLKVVIEMD